MKAKILEGNVLETLKDLPDCSVQCVVTSPPYYGLRDYGVDGQIGLEPTPEAYVETLVNVFREVRRVLKDDGTLWLNLGDSYAGSWGNYGGQNRGNGTQREITKGSKVIQKSYEGKERWKPPTAGTFEGIKPKDLFGIPWLVAFALRADGWWLRSDIVWNKPNPMPESVEDRPTRSHEYIFLMSKSAIYYYDHEAIKEPLSSASIQRLSQANFDNQTGGAKDYQHGTNKNRSARRALVNLKGRAMPPQVADDPERWANLSGRNKRDVWTVTTKPYKEAHFATFPPDLIEPCILAGSKEGDTVLDPFNGSGTTGEVSIKHNRFYIGCEINPDYVSLTKRRLSKVQPVLPQGKRTTPPAPDGGDSAPSQALSTPDMFSAIEHEPTPAPRR